MSHRSLFFAFIVTLSASASLVALSACGGPPAAATDASQAHIDGAKAKKLVSNGAKLVDVRGADEFGAKHIDGAENDPAETIEDVDFGGKDTAIVLYCDSGARAARAAGQLRAKGYTHVYELGAMANWNK